MATLETFNFSLEDKMAGQQTWLLCWLLCWTRPYDVFCDNFFTSFPLLMTWSELQFFWAAQLKQIIIACQQACTIRGPRWSHSRKENQCFSLVEILWPLFGRIQNWCPSLAHNQILWETIKSTGNSGTVTEVPKVPAAVSYKKNMGSVDLNHQHRNYYAVEHKSRKWRKYPL